MLVRGAPPQRIPDLPNKLASPFLKKSSMKGRAGVKSLAAPQVGQSVPRHQVAVLTGWFRWTSPKNRNACIHEPPSAHEPLNETESDCEWKRRNEPEHPLEDAPRSLGRREHRCQNADRAGNQQPVTDLVEPDRRGDAGEQDDPGDRGHREGAEGVG